MVVAPGMVAAPGMLVISQNTLKEASAALPYLRDSRAIVTRPAINLASQNKGAAAA